MGAPKLLPSYSLRRTHYYTFTGRQAEGREGIGGGRRDGDKEVEIQELVRSIDSGGGVLYGSWQLPSNALYYLLPIIFYPFSRAIYII
jgi:hypothetical protein